MQRMLGAQGLDKLQVNIAEIEVSQTDSDAFDDFTQHYRQTECFMIKLERFAGIADNYRHVIELPRHSRTLACLHSNDKPAHTSKGTVLISLGRRSRVHA